jgi:hypothetical protein
MNRLLTMPRLIFSLSATILSAAAERTADRTMYEPGVPEQDMAGAYFGNLYLLGEIGFENFGEGGGVGS